MTFRLYEPSECGKDSYPLEWHTSLKHLVRQEAGYRCVRCKHPYENGKHGKGEWTPCDAKCTHGGPLRVWASIWPTAKGGQVHEEAFPPQIVMCQPAPYLFEIGKVEAAWRILTVHHLDGNKRNCHWWNLAALCQRCHLEIQGRVKMDQVYPWEHSEWFKPYAAGYYAYHYLKESLTREEVERRLSELLALECVTG